MGGRERSVGVGRKGMEERRERKGGKGGVKVVSLDQLSLGA